MGLSLCFQEDVKDDITGQEIVHHSNTDRENYEDVSTYKIVKHI